jgi:hypothetical protein
MSKTLL